MTKPTAQQIVTALSWFGVGVVAVAFGRSLAAAGPSVKPAYHQSSGTGQILAANPIPPPPPPPPPAAPPPPPAKKVSHHVATAKPRPVVAPSPASNVTGLAPVAPSGGSQSGPATTTGYTSTNWSGYLATNASFTGVAGSWIVPNVTGPAGTTSADSTWVGIGGVTAGDLIQVGTDNIVAANGTVTTNAFYETLPQASINIDSITVHQGDAVTASLAETSPGLWLVTITDSSDGQSFSASLSYTSTHSSVEWIEEDPSYSSRRQIPFDSFTSVSFGHGSATTTAGTTTIAGTGYSPVTMVDRSGQPLAIPSALLADGAGFSVNRSGS